MLKFIWINPSRTYKAKLMNYKENVFFICFFIGQLWKTQKALKLVSHPALESLNSITTTKDYLRYLGHVNATITLAWTTSATFLRKCLLFCQQTNHVCKFLGTIYIETLYFRQIDKLTGDHRGNRINQVSLLNEGNRFFPICRKNPHTGHCDWRKINI